MNEQHNNHQQKDVLTIYNEAAKAVTNEQYRTVSSTPAQTGKKLPLAAEQFVPSRRTRINRLIIRRRLHERYHRDLVPRLVIGTIIFFILLFSLSSSGVGAAYAYYQAQLPLLNGVADHALFQSTHIYDRNGHLLYELYDHQDGHGRRTYVNYSDISPLLIQATVAPKIIASGKIMALTCRALFVPLLPTCNIKRSLKEVAQLPSSSSKINSF